MMEKNYLELMLNGSLILHLNYINKEKNEYFFQNIWLGNAVEQYGIEKCREELEKNLRGLLERTKKEYEKFNRSMPLNDNTFKNYISILEKILKQGGKIKIFGLGKEEKKIDMELIINQ